MKKITLFFAALLMTAISANAQVIFGQYVDGAFVENDDPSKIGVAQNPHCLTFAVAVTNDELYSIIESDSRLTVAFAQIRNQENEFFENLEIRMIRVTPSNSDEYGDIFYISQFDLGTVPENPTVVSDATHLHSQIVVSASQAAMDEDPTFEYWWVESTEAGWDPGLNYAYLGEWDESNTLCETAVEDIFADKGEVVSVELFSILGAKLPATAKGLVIAKATYADGSVESKKVVIE